MGVTKTDLFTEKQNELAKVAKVFAHPARVAILEFLIQSNSCINGDLVQELGLAQATISQHLRELKEIGIIKGSIEGVSVNYCIDPIRWAEIQNLFQELFSGFPKISGCC
ncbi:ArsR/SmtB family transcription factor [Aquiflexum lacus]|jgi:ArsR family transcriptional regulator, zinc-responsive transcriptional repressor|uniref:ArsR/SmtB family transcription factor n=1 Tax=Aquiflexum lacus TaxID=2483805 RepID=UPI0018933B39|nr:metalloregulator ArsR/SmtB family transcription factor [Aquiflexum lacus]